MGTFDFDEELPNDLNELIAQYEDAVNNNKNLLLDQESLESIIEYYEDLGNYEKALDVVEQSLVHYPYSAILLLKKAQLFFDMKLCSEALESLEKAEIYDPSEIDIFLLKAEIYTFQSQYKEAIEILEGLFKIADREDLPEIYLRLADVYEDSEKYFDVFECLKKALEIDLENEEALNRINYCVEITEKFEDSIRFHKKLLEEKPYCVYAWYNLACSYDGIGMYEKAIEALEYVIAIDEIADYAYQDLAEMHFKLGNYQKALQTLKEFHNFSQGDEEVFFLEGQCNEALDNLKMARYCYRKALHINPSFHEAIFKIGETYVKEDQWLQALKAFAKAAELDPQESEYWLGVAEASLYLENYEQSLKAGEESLYLKPNNVRAYVLTVKTYLVMGDLAASKAILAKGFDYCRETMELKAAEVALLYYEGKRKEAFLEFEETVRANPDHSEIVYYLMPEVEEDEEFKNLVTIIKQEKGIL